MKELMLHVERIVRPVAAMQSRKLRMREELLTHLLAVLEQERDRGTDELTAIERARQRLGDSEEITRQLQRTVPIWERLLNLKIEVSVEVEEIENDLARMVFGKRHTNTLAHASVLLIMLCALAFVPYCASPLVRGIFTRSSGVPSHAGLFFIGFALGLNVILIASARHVFAMACSTSRFDLSSALWRSAMILGLHVVLIIFLAFSAFDRSATINELSICAASTISLLAVSMLLSRWIAVVRQRYDAWLSLDLSGEYA